MPDPQRATPAGTLRLGSLLGTQVYVSSSWLVIAALIAVAVAPQAETASPGLGAGKYVVGVVVAVVLYVAVLVHELSHVVVVRHFGHRVPSITLSFMGGRTAVEGEARTPGQEFLAAVVGPLASLGVGALALVLYLPLPAGVPSVVVGALAFANLGLGAMNLAPVLPLDGGRVLKALVWWLTGSAVRGIVVAAWAARVLAVLLVLAAALLAPALGRSLPLLDLAIVGVLAVFLIMSSTSEIAGARLRERFSAVVVRDLARPTLAVDPDLPLAEAVRRAGEAGAGAILTVDAQGAPLGLVHEASVRAVPVDRRAWVPTSSVSRTLVADLCLPDTITGDQLLAAINEDPAPQYVLLDREGGVRGVLALADLDRAVGLT